MVANPNLVQKQKVSKLNVIKINKLHKECDINQAIDIIINAKTNKISGCNALDKVLIDENLPECSAFISKLISKLLEHKVKILGDENIQKANKLVHLIPSQNTWYEEFLDYKIVLGQVASLKEAISKINTFGGGHSAAIITANEETAATFMNSVDSAAVYHNASTRFTDGGQFGLGGELAISTDKLHQRGPIGLHHLVTNKWFVKGNGQIR
jgi:glutamate-5-semialdehyde dehydrogenase